MLKFLKRLNFFAIIRDIIKSIFIFCGFFLLYLLTLEYPVTLTRDALPLMLQVSALYSVSLRLAFECIVKGKYWLKPKEPELDISISSENVQNDRIAAIHEAGHVVVAYVLGIDNIHVKMKTHLGSGTSYSSPYLPYAEDVRKRILMCYSEAIAEELLLGKHSAGSYGSKDADFVQAAEQLKIYLLQTNPSNSKAMVESELADQMVATSKTLYEEATELLRQHMDKLEIIAKELETVSELRHEQIQQLLEPASNHT